MGAPGQWADPRAEALKGVAGPDDDYRTALPRPSSPRRHRAAGPSLALTVTVALGGTLSCGRVGYQVVGDGDAGRRGGSDATDSPPDRASTASDVGADGPSIAFYMGPSGADTNPGTLALPWKTWSHALAQLDPGETLVLLDGTYGVSTGAGMMHVVCGEGGTVCEGKPCQQGQASRPITVKALNERRAKLLYPVGGTQGSLTVEQCNFWEFEGLHIEGGDDAAGSMYVARIDGARDIVLRRSLFLRDNRFKNSMLLEISNTRNIVVSDNEFFRGHRNAITFWYSTGVIARRNFINGGDGTAGSPTADLMGGFDSRYNCPKNTDTGIDLWGSSGGILENNVIEGACRAIAVVTTNSETGPAGAGDNARVLANVARDSAVSGFNAESTCAGANPCVADNQVVTAPTFAHNISIAAAVGFDSLGVSALSLQHQSVFSPSQVGVRLWRPDLNAGLMPTATVTDTQVVGGPGTKGFLVRDHVSWLIDHSNAYQSGVNYDPLDLHVTASTQVNPALGACKVEIPAGSPLKGAGTGGSDVGATIRFRTEDGVLTRSPLWDPITGQFPCGAVIPGVNDEATFPNGTCRTLHQRLDIAPGCGR